MPSTFIRPIVAEKEEAGAVGAPASLFLGGETLFDTANHVLHFMNHDMELFGEREYEIFRFRKFPLNPPLVLAPNRDHVVEALRELHANCFARSILEPAMVPAVHVFAALSLCLNWFGDVPHQLGNVGVEFRDDAVVGPDIRAILKRVVQKDCADDVGIPDTHMHDGDKRACTEVFEIRISVVALLVAKRFFHRVVRAPNHAVGVARLRPNLADPGEEGFFRLCLVEKRADLVFEPRRQGVCEERSVLNRARTTRRPTHYGVHEFPLN